MCLNAGPEGELPGFEFYPLINYVTLVRLPFSDSMSLSVKWE